MSFPRLIPALLTTAALLSQLALGHCWQQDAWHELVGTHAEPTEEAEEHHHHGHNHAHHHHAHEHEHDGPAHPHHHCPHSSGDHDCACDTLNSYVTAAPATAPALSLAADFVLPALVTSLLSELLIPQSLEGVEPPAPPGALPLRAQLQTWRC